MTALFVVMAIVFGFLGGLFYAGHKTLDSSHKAFRDWRTKP